MKRKITTKIKTASLLFAILLFGIKANAQVRTYCEPTFNNGCATWSNQEIQLGSINWLLSGTDCATSDYTSMSTTLTKGVATPMMVTNASWCGVGVWIDFNMDETFDSTENLFHLYDAGDPQTYNFNITVPLTAPGGTFRMRVIAGWGTDCYGITSTNGYGGCGTYEYGNFDDFTVNVIPVSGAGIDELSTNVIGLNVSPNPANETITVNITGNRETNANLALTDVTGKLLQTIKVTNDKQTVDLTAIASGMYFLTYTDSKNKQVIKLNK